MNAPALFKCDTCGGLFDADDITVGEHNECHECGDERAAEALAAARVEYHAPLPSLFDILVDAADAARAYAKEHPRG